MTPQQAAKACVLGTRRIIDLWFSDSKLAALEREFTEIISQVTPHAFPITEGEWVDALRSNLASEKSGSVDEFRDLILLSGTIIANTFGFDNPTNRAALQRMLFPQEIVEPQPKPWWKRRLR